MPDARDIDWSTSGHAFKPGSPSAKEAAKKSPSTMSESAAKGLTGGAAPMDRRGVPAEAKKKGGTIKKYARGGGVESRGKTKGRMC